MATEKRLIDANALTDNFSFLRKMWSGTEIMTVIDETPTVDAVEVVHGRWDESIDNGTVMHVCSVCGARAVKGLYEYENPNRNCYHCGAKMDK